MNVARRHSRERGAAGAQHNRRPGGPVAARLTARPTAPIVNSMRRFIFAALLVGAGAGGARAQQVPARELLEFPFATVAEPQALSRRVAGALWNPALLAPMPSAATRISAAALNTPIAQGVTAQYLGVGHALGRGVTVGGSVLRAQVSDLVRTDDDPSSIPFEDDIPYSTTLWSLSAARRFGPLSAGASLRHRRGTADVRRDGATSVDVGIAVDRIGSLPLRAGASTFLMSPGAGDREPRTVVAAIEAPVVRDTTHEGALGYSFLQTQRYGHEHYLYGSARWRRLFGVAGLAQHHGAVSRTRRLRLGLGLQHARYEVGLAREETGGGLGASYQFNLTATFP